LLKRQFGSLRRRSAGCALNQSLDIFRNYIDLKIDRRARRERTQIGHLQSVRYNRNLKPAVTESRYREANPFNRYRAFHANIAAQLLRITEAHDNAVADRTFPDQLSGAVDVALHDMAAESAADGKRPLKIDRRTRTQAAQSSARERFGGDIESKPFRIEFDDRQADSIDRHAVSETDSRP